MDKKFTQAKKEAKIAFILAIVYLILWIASAYLLGNGSGILGLPLWFEASCIYLPLFFTLLCWLIVKYMFVDLPLDIKSESNNK
ncbi:YhdT family protein [Candidatus Schmidhempelia bombi]|uniref:DUF997 family protein n=1 Tax=Candidatus Schmidhempelia bombi str. Bimp TaxID=1387197 RepID=A0AB94IC94_9GAMM|nr:DUF997 family protein [Candidatus Schmidhempelia bombi]TEA27030.1 DUF997 family protein [Candidatus Schmidhempelia bombi str. Bimp]